MVKSHNHLKVVPSVPGPSDVPADKPQLLRHVVHQVQAASACHALRVTGVNTVIAGEFSKIKIW